MTEFAYFQLVAENITTFVGALILAFLMYYCLLSRKVNSIFDPLFLAFVSSSVGFATVVFLYMMKTINLPYFLSYLATQAGFILGFLWAGSPPSKSGKVSDSRLLGLLPSPGALSVLLIVVPVYLLASVIFYAKFGIPLLSEESRLDNYYATDVWSSLLNKMFYPTAIIAATLGVLCWRSPSITARGLARVSIALVAINSLLSGSKGGLLLLVGVIYYCKIFFDDWHISPPPPLTKIIAKYGLIIMGAVVGVGIAVSSMRYGSGGLGVLVYRLLLSGDIYYLAYPNHVLDSIHSTSLPLALFPGIGALLGFGEKSIPLGAQIFEYVNGYQRLEAPNARHNIFGLLHLGYVFSVMYSCSLGYLLGFARFRLLRSLGSRVLGIVTFISVTFALSGVEGDANLAISNFIGSIICCSIYLSFGVLIDRASRVGADIAHGLD